MVVMRLPWAWLSLPRFPSSGMYRLDYPVRESATPANVAWVEVPESYTDADFSDGLPMNEQGAARYTCHCSVRSPARSTTIPSGHDWERRSAVEAPQEP